MNQDQYLSLVRTALLVGGILIADRVSTSDWQTITSAVLVIAPIVWAMFAHAPSKAIREMAGSTK